MSILSRLLGDHRREPRKMPAIVRENEDHIERLKQEIAERQRIVDEMGGATKLMQGIARARNGDLNGNGAG